MTANLTRRVLSSTIPLSVRVRFHENKHKYVRQFMKRPRFLIIGTGRCGTNYVADYLNASGVPCGHEKFYSVHGPNFKDKREALSRWGDSSWLAVPYLKNSNVPIVHQTRHPIKVIKSFHDIGFFHTENYQKHKKFVDFASQFFEISDDPVISCMKWYTEWNQRCREITKHHYQVEAFSESLDNISNWLELENALPNIDVSKTVNSRQVSGSKTIDEFSEIVASKLEYYELSDISASFGYKL